MNPVSLLMARYQDPDVTPRQAPAWRAPPRPLLTGRHRRGEPAASPRNPVLPALTPSSVTA